MEILKALSDLREVLKTKEKELMTQAYLFNENEAKLKLMKTTRKRKNVEKKIFALIPKL